MKIISALFLLMLSTAPLAAQTTTQTVVDVLAGAVIDSVFSADEKRVIDDYLKNRGGLPGNDAVRDSRDRDEDRKVHKNKKNKNKANKGKGKHKKLPPGLAKRKELPPGLKRQLERRRTLPPGLAVRELPDDLVAQLPEPRKGTDRIVVEDDIVLIEKATGRILDIILGRGTNQ